MYTLRNCGFEILQFSLCEGWVNNLFDGNNKPHVFATLEEAIAELQEEFDDWQAEMATGERGKDEGYEICTFRIMCNATSTSYEPNLIEGKVIVSHRFSYH